MTNKKLFIAEKPSVAQQFADALKVKGGRKDGYLEDDNYIVTWCVGHLVGMSYPDAYDEKLKYELRVEELFHGARSLSEYLVEEFR